MVGGYNTAQNTAQPYPTQPSPTQPSPAQPSPGRGAGATRCGETNPTQTPTSYFLSGPAARGLEPARGREWCHAGEELACGRREAQPCRRHCRAVLTLASRFSGSGPPGTPSVSCACGERQLESPNLGPTRDIFPTVACVFVGREGLPWRRCVQLCGVLAMCVIACVLFYRSTTAPHHRCCVRGGCVVTNATGCVPQ